MQCQSLQWVWCGAMFWWELDECADVCFSTAKSKSTAWTSNRILVPPDKVAEFRYVTHWKTIILRLFCEWTHPPPTAAREVRIPSFICRLEEHQKGGLSRNIKNKTANLVGEGDVVQNCAVQLISMAFSFVKFLVLWNLPCSWASHLRFRQVNLRHSHCKEWKKSWIIHDVLWVTGR